MNPEDLKQAQLTRNSGGYSSSRPTVPVRGVDTICPYCGVGCAVTYYVNPDGNRIFFAEGRAGVANDERLCVKGRFGFDYANHAQRLTKPLIRKAESYPKRQLSQDLLKPGIDHVDGSGPEDYGAVLNHFREASWEEALALAADGLKSLRDKHGGDALAGFGSAKGTNEEAYLFQKLVRAGFGTNNVDHCTRLCHASSVAALMESIGSGAVTNIVRDVARADVALIAGSNTTENHPVAATFIQEAARTGTRLLVINPRRVEISRSADLFLHIRPGSDVALFNAMIHVLIAEDLIDREFIEKRTEGFEELRAATEKYTPQRAAQFCGVSAEKVVEAARMFGGASAAMIFWGMGISQHTHGTDNARCLISLALLTGNVGRPGTGLHPLRGQNNVQGASDAGLIPMVYPGYQDVADPEIHQWFERYWERPLSTEPGLTVTEIMSAAIRGDVKGMYIVGENPILSDPDQAKARQALEALDFLVVQEIFLTETAEYADVILPSSSALGKEGTVTNTDRRVQLMHPVITPPGEARQDWELICELGNRLGLPMHYDSPAQVFDEMAGCSPAYSTFTHENLGPLGKWYPCPDPAKSDGESLMFQDSFPVGRARMVPAQFSDPDELPSPEYPFVLDTGRVLSHWHTGVMSRRSTALDAITPEAYVELHPDDATRLNVADGEQVRIRSRRGQIMLQTRVTDRPWPGAVFVPMHFHEAAVNALTNPALDPAGKIPEFKYCAVSIEAVNDEATGEKQPSREQT